jgi:hypothetical protein
MTLAVKASATQQSALSTNIATTAALALISTLGLLESTVLLQLHAIERLEDAIKARGLYWSELRIAVT